MTSVLFVCTGNSARSILAECLLNHLGAGWFEAFSAGSHPQPRVNPFAVEVLEANGVPVVGLAPKSWDDFSGEGAASDIDIVITVCDAASQEPCPIWPGHPVVAHWGLADPAAVEGATSDKGRAFEVAFGVLKARVEALVGLDLDHLEDEALCARLAEIGGLEPDLSPF